MAIRNATKAIILCDDKILVNRCIQKGTNLIYYDLPGGGQHQYENMEEAVVREVLEETGYMVEIIRFAGLAEEIHNSERIRKEYPDYSHRILHIFIVRLLDVEKTLPTEIDFQQQDSVWLTLSEADTVTFFPEQLTGNISSVIISDIPKYLGCSYLNSI